MLSVLLVSVMVAMLLAISFIQKNRGHRARLIRLAGVSIFGGVVLREITPIIGNPSVLDLLKLLASYLSIVAVILLILSFRKPPVTSRTRAMIWLATVLVSALQICLYLLLTVTHDEESFVISAEAGMPPMAFMYSGMNDIILIAMAVTAFVGGQRALKNQRLPIIGKIAMSSYIMAAVTTTLYAMISIAKLLTLIPHVAIIRDQLLIATMSFAFFGLISGGLLKVFGRDGTLSTAAAICIVKPLWSTTTQLEPHVILPGENLNSRERLARLFVETHDALSLLRRDPDPALTMIREVHPEDPQLTASILIHLLGAENVSAPPRRRDALCMYIVTKLSSKNSTASTHSIYNIRQACANHGDQRRIPAT